MFPKSVFEEACPARTKVRVSDGSQRLAGVPHCLLWEIPGRCLVSRVKKPFHTPSPQLHRAAVGLPSLQRPVRS